MLRQRRPSAGTLLITVGLFAFPPSGLGGQAQETDLIWIAYTNPTLGFSLRYPASLELVLEGPDDYGKVDGQKLIVKLVTKRSRFSLTSNERITALRMIVKEANGPTHPNWDASYLRRLNGFHEMVVGGRFAARYIVCGIGGRCHWTVTVPGSRELIINTWDEAEDAKQGPEDAKYPLLSIINSITFDPKVPP